MMHSKNNLAWWPIFVSAYCIPVYVSFIILKNSDFAMGFVILAIYFWLKTTIFNVKTEKPNGIKNKIAW